MATTSRTPSVGVSGARGTVGVLGRNFYFGMSLLVAAVVIYGFSHTVNRNLVHADPSRPLLLWLHGTLFSGWVAFFVLQSALVRTRNVRIHRTIGWFGAALSAGMMVVGPWTAIVMGRFHTTQLHDTSLRSFLIVPFWDMTCFAICFWLAVARRKQPEWHRRLMLVSTCVLTAAAFGRFPGSFGQLWFYAGVDGLILLGAIRDLVVNRRVHPAYLYTLPVLACGQYLVMHTVVTAPLWWMRIAQSLVG